MHYRLLLVFILNALAYCAWAKPPLELYWEDLVPKNYVAPETAIVHDGSMTQPNLDAPVVKKHDGKLVRIPGFVVPLEGSATETKEFLLVPYFGACIHVPPPPPNQIVYVKFSEGVPIDNLYDAIWVEGTLSTKGWSGDIATVGYTLEGIKIEPFEG
ncbi:DUF3299 domain-containing protein [Aestuariibacter sp. AA17]|uniref:DUF3299 domain-containing protein n=1 Tax=Fluctibacter corallii TaxID=2984329 RepID=A0ABT3AC58_9ALTE|nr:DUF3299 domain-containing protein [Aestuariibacter sp. AA17]MCV2886268.1 DUF3299 domain-containing protein [Aestuariibacter sp. AA17]